MPPSIALCNNANQMMPTTTLNPRQRRCIKVCLINGLYLLSFSAQPSPAQTNGQHEAAPNSGAVKSTGTNTADTTEFLIDWGAGSGQTKGTPTPISPDDQSPQPPAVSPAPHWLGPHSHLPHQLPPFRQQQQQQQQQQPENPFTEVIMRVQRETALKMSHISRAHALQLHELALEAIKLWEASAAGKEVRAEDKSESPPPTTTSPFDGNGPFAARFNETSDFLKMKQQAKDGKYQLHAAVNDRDSSQRRMDGYGVAGVSVRMREIGYPIVDTAMSGTPAESAGINSGDEILVVNGHELDQERGANFWHWMTGKPGTMVTITVARDSRPLTFHLSRANIADLTDPNARAFFEHQFYLNGATGQP
jgi:PDZ domain